MGGEKVSPHGLHLQNQGSPPRGRGKVQAVCPLGELAGITPAWAGKSGASAMTSSVPWDHPRVGGEKSLLFAASRASVGSPPHGRGKGQGALDCRFLERITPAWAGKRRPQQRHRMALQDHPRMGGEKSISIRFAQDAAGSPPHRRGKGCCHHLMVFVDGITPAWAGKRAARGGSSSSSWDHPRVGGEKYCMLLCCPAGWGSPPRGRGKECVL